MTHRRNIARQIAAEDGDFLSLPCYCARWGLPADHPLRVHPANVTWYVDRLRRRQGWARLGTSVEGHPVWARKEEA